MLQKPAKAGHADLHERRSADNSAAMEKTGSDIKSAPLGASAPLLVFDSGIGGLSVLSAIRDTLPDAPIIYAADHAFLPYGDKSEAEIDARIPALLGRLTERYRPRLVIIACNTASTIALPHMRAAIDIPVVGTVPAIKPAAERSQSKVLGLLGTEATLRQPYVDQLQADHAADCKLIRHAAPQLVLAAEAKLRGEHVDPAIYIAAMEGLTKQTDGHEIDQVVLGCTHFPLLHKELAKAAGERISFVDGAAGIARRVDVLTQGQVWPDAPPPDVFVTTAADFQKEQYHAALAEYGLQQFATL